MSAPVASEASIQPALPVAEPVPPAPTPEPAAEPAPGGFASFATTVAPGQRLVSLDAYRGFIMLAMASGGFAIPLVVKNMAKLHPDQEVPAFWKFLAFHTDHVPWIGCSFWDLIQPSFMFMVGVALPYSYAARKSKGASERNIYAHVVFRALLLILLGVFLSSNWSKLTNFTFVNVLSQIGLGYVFVHLLVNRGLAIQSAALALLLGGYWAFFYFHPLPPADFDYRTVGLPTTWELLDGTFAHWNKNVNAAADFDQWFLNLFPYNERTNALTGTKMTAFVYNDGGYQTLNFIPSMATMLLGLMAGELLRSREYNNIEKWIRLVAAGLFLLVAGMVMGAMVCPLVKRIWTPSWVLYSTAFTFWMLAAFYLVIDMGGWKKWTWPLVVVGMNSIAIYVMAQLMKGWIVQTSKIHFGYLYTDFVKYATERDWLGDDWKAAFGTTLFGGLYGPIVESAAVLLVLWLICVWMYRQKIFVKI